MDITRQFIRWIHAISLLACLLASGVAHAYSYAAAGKEPVIDGREAILVALSNEDYVAVKAAIDGLSEEFAYLKADHDVDLLTPMLSAIGQQQASEVEHLMDKMMYEEIVRRLEGAQNNLADYQVAKVLVVKSKLFLDLLAPKLEQESRQIASQSIQGVLAAIGNPGVFGVGQAPADPQTFKEQRSALMSALRSFK
ncbi:hypothetical protein L4C54_11030 [Vibrio lamellibrachiae]|uniref:hypothetical protein n=1 Tax=Vibrio lamellibrachiae TaxID=2910253 RepID=UPI003D143402